MSIRTYDAKEKARRCAEKQAKKNSAHAQMAKGELSEYYLKFIRPKKKGEDK